jgi:hypothetical protein
MSRSWACVYVTLPSVSDMTGHACGWFFQ